MCYGGKQVSAMVRDNSADDGGGKRWEASEGVFAALEISGGNAPVPIYDDPTDPAIATDPEGGPGPPGAHPAGGQRRGARPARPAEPLPHGRCAVRSFGQPPRGRF